MLEEKTIKASKTGRKQSSVGAFLVSTMVVALASTALSTPAFAQTDLDRPVTVHENLANTPAENSAADRFDEHDILPEHLSGPKPVYIRPSDVKRERDNSRNRWNPQTLTQTTGLKASSIRRGMYNETNMLMESVAPGTITSDLINPADLLHAGTKKLVSLSPPQVVQPLEDGVINLHSSVRDSLFDLSGDSVNASVFKLDLGEQLCLGTAEECAANVGRNIDAGYAKNITKGKPGGFNLQLTPRAGIHFEDDKKSAIVGAIVRIGDNLREGADMKSNTWYLFAGADAEAMTYTPGGVKRLTSGEFHLQDRIIVGDAQAGVGYRIGDADLALSYFKRQASAENYSYNEDAAALSITWKR